MRAGLFLILFWFSAAGAVSRPPIDCPPRDSAELTISQVMIFFGKHLLFADMLSMRGMAGNASVTREEVAQAVAGINSAMNCAKYLLDDCAELLLPSKVKTYSQADRGEYASAWRSVKPSMTPTRTCDSILAFFVSLSVAMLSLEC